VRRVLENYIIRIFRRDEKDPARVAGLLESVERETRYSFQSWDELRDLLLSADDRKCRQYRK
jgi:hypothetical protein